MNLNQSCAAWMHQARRLWRQAALAAAAEQLGHSYPRDIQWVDWAATIGPKSKRHVMLSTIQANALNTKDRLERHFHAGCGMECEHQCGEEDHVAHRLLRCIATRQLCRQVGLQEQHLGYMETLPRCHVSLSIWLHPPEVREFLLRQEQAWGLWPTRTWLKALRLVEHLPAVLNLVFQYQLGPRQSRRRTRRHPENLRHMARISLVETHLPPKEAIACTTGYSKLEWEKDAFIFAGITAVLLNRQVQYGASPLHPIVCAWTSARRIAQSRILLNSLASFKIKSLFRPLTRSTTLSWSSSCRLGARNFLDCYVLRMLSLMLGNFIGTLPASIRLSCSICLSTTLELLSSAGTTVRCGEVLRDSARERGESLFSSRRSQASISLPESSPLPLPHLVGPGFGCGSFLGLGPPPSLF